MAAPIVGGTVALATVPAVAAVDVTEAAVVAPVAAVVEYCECHTDGKTSKALYAAGKSSANAAYHAAAAGAHLTAAGAHATRAAAKKAYGYAKKKKNPKYCTCDEGDWCTCPAEDADEYCTCDEVRERVLAKLNERPSDVNPDGTRKSEMGAMEKLFKGLFSGTTGA
jgi:hypothetical protein